MSNDLTKSSASPPVALTPTIGVVLWRKRSALVASVSEDDQRAAKIEEKIKQLTVLLDRGAAVIKGTPRLAAVFAPRTASIEARIAELQRQAAEIRAASTPKRKELEDITLKIIGGSSEPQRTLYETHTRTRV